MAWENFSKKLKDVIRKRGFERPTDVQSKGTPVIHDGGDVLLMAPTGLGKTESCMLPLFDLMVSKEREYKPISILYITPLKSLNRDLLKRMLWWGGELGFDVSVRHGDTTQYERGMQAENPPHVLILTPETLQAVLVGKRMRSHLGNVKHVVIDEIHELVDGKRGVQLSIGLERLKEAIREAGNPIPQMIGISATVGSPEKVANFLNSGKDASIVNAMSLRKTSLVVESPRPTARDKDLSSKVFMGPKTTARIRRIEQIIKEKGSVLAFTNTRESSEILSSRLRVLDPELKIETHHSSLSKNVRIMAEEEFKEGRLRSLICTSSLELGIDIGQIDFILQYMSPRQVAKLTQRLGRSNHTVSGVSDGIIIAAELDDVFESAAIARHALKGKIEPTRVYGKSLDVLAHQIVGLSLDEYGISYEKAFGIIRRAQPFAELTETEFLESCMHLQRQGFIWLNDNASPPEPGKASVVTKNTKRSDVVIRRRKRGWEYYYRNLSTIPDTKNYQIFDVVSNQPVGSLDAEFMALHGSPGTSFIVKGRAWKILEVQRTRVMVEPTAGIEASVPAWEGELIPVPRDISQDVLGMRTRISRLISEGKPMPEAVRDIMKNYPVDKSAASRMYGYVAAQQKFGHHPDEGKLLIEYGSVEGELNVIIHSFFGSIINDTLGRVVSSLLISKFGSVGLQTDPYRIILKMQNGSVQDVVDTLKGLDKQTIESVIRLSLPNTELFRWRFIHVAQRMGIISRDAEFGPAYIRKVIESYKDRPPTKEAMHEVFEEKLDIPGAAEVVESISVGKLGIKVVPGLSPYANAGLFHRYEIIAPKKPDLEIFRTFSNRLMNTRVRLLCTNCGSGISRTVSEVSERPHCVNCQSRLLAVTGTKNIDAELLLNRHIRKGSSMDATPDEEEALKKLEDSASLVAASGRRAVIAQAGRGIGPRTAARILRRQTDGDEMLKDILKEEQLFARNKRFWRGD